MADSKMYQIGGREWRVKIGPPTLALAEMRGLELGRGELQEMSVGALGCRLVAAALMAEDEDVTEQQVLQWLHQQSDTDEILAHVLSEYNALQTQFMQWTRARTETQVQGLIGALAEAGVTGGDFDVMAEALDGTGPPAQEEAEQGAHAEQDVEPSPVEA